MSSEKVVAVELNSYTNGGGYKRGSLSVLLESGSSLEVTSPSEAGEPAGVANYDYQKDAGVNMAKANGVRFVETDLDLIAKIKKARGIQ